ncbi:hypothetical protein AGMMS49983_12230 [Clostridia bacterium]|nr:hypothetical protein AGMMS49983_12230 [Clostridia bacterium]
MLENFTIEIVGGIISSFLHEPIPTGHEVRGFVAMEQLRAVDLTTRPTEYIGHLSKQEMRPIFVCVRSFFDA